MYFDKLLKLKGFLGEQRPFLIAILEKGESVFNTLKLDAELAKFEGGPPPPPPSLLAEKDAAWKLLYRKGAKIHSRLLISDIESRKIMAFEILSICEHLENYWAEIDFYKKNGYWPEKAFKLGGDAENMRRVANLRSYISKFRKDPAKAAKVTLWEAELETLLNMIE